MSDFGVCTDCGGWTEVDDPCCGVGVFCEGSVRYPPEKLDDDPEDDPPGPKAA